MPPDCLLAVDAGRDPRWGNNVCLPGVSYRSIIYSQPRWVKTRFNPAGPLFMAAIANRLTSSVVELLRPFHPEMILTVTSKYLWMPAASAAKKLGIPLALILHDDWATYETGRRSGKAHDLVRWACRRIVRRAYRQAAVRFCVSPGMVEQCLSWFGAPGTLLYPSRGKDSPAARVRVRENRSGGPVVAFCGHVHQDGTATLLRELAHILASMNGRLDMYTPHSPETLAAWGLCPPHVRHVGFLPPKVMAEQLGTSADALFLPASFELLERVDVATLFPSKLTDYTAIGLPILIWGPDYSSVNRWAADNQGAAAVVSARNPQAVSGILNRLVTERLYATQLAQRAIDAGYRDFELAGTRRVFWDAIQAARVRGQTVSLG